MVNKTNSTKASIGVSIFLLILSITLIYFSLKQQFYSDQQKENLHNDIKQTVNQALKESQNQPSQFPDYDSLNRIKRLSLINKPFESWTPDSKLEPKMIVNKIILNKGELSKGYIYVKASLDRKALSAWESIFLKMNYTGGHLFRSKSLAVPPSDKTELLYSLDYVPYLEDIPYNESLNPLVTNWFQFFLPGQEIQIISFISSLKPALIEDLAVYYECKKDSDCLLTLK